MRQVRRVAVAVKPALAIVIALLALPFTFPLYLLSILSRKAIKLALIMSFLLLNILAAYVGFFNCFMRGTNYGSRHDIGWAWVVLPGAGIGCGLGRRYSGATKPWAGKESENPLWREWWARDRVRTKGD